MLGFDPNITGSIYDDGSYGNQLIGDTPSGSGCFSIVLPRNKIGIGADGDAKWGCSGLIFNASSSDKIYGDSMSVQPSAIQTLIIIKDWIALGCTVEEAPKISFDFLAKNSNPVNPEPVSYGPEIMWSKFLGVIAPAPVNSLSITDCAMLSAVRLPVMLGHTETQHNGFS